MIRRLFCSLACSGLLLLPLLLPLLAGCGGAPPLPPSAPTNLLGQPGPALDTTTTTGARVSPEVLRSRVVVVKFFARSCVPCQRTLPAAEKLHRAHPAVAFLGVAEDESLADVEEQIHHYGLTFPIIHDRDNSLIGRFHTSEMPATFVIDSKGLVRWFGGGAQAEGDLEKAIAAVSAAP